VTTASRKTRKLELQTKNRLPKNIGNRLVTATSSTHGTNEQVENHQIDTKNQKLKNFPTFTIFTCGRRKPKNKKTINGHKILSK